MNKIVKIVWKNKVAAMIITVLVLAVWMPLVKSDPASYQSGRAGGVNTEYMNVTYLRAPTSAGSTIVVAASNSYNEYHANYQCDGIADEVQIEAAIAQVSTGGSICLLDGQFNISNTINLTSLDGIKIYGSGDTTVYASDNSDCDVFAIQACSNITFRDFTIDGNRAGQTIYIGGAAIELYNGSGCHLDTIHIKNTPYHGIDLGWTDNTTIVNCIVEGIGTVGHYGMGIAVSQGSENCTVSNCIAKNCIESGFRCWAQEDGSYPSRYITFVGCHSQDNGRDGYGIQNCSYITFDSCVAFTSTDVGFRLSNSLFCSVENCKSSVSGDEGILLDVVGNATIIGNTVTYAGLYGIKIYNGGSSSIVSDNFIKYTVEECIRISHAARVAIIGNICFYANYTGSASESAGINLRFWSHNCTVVGNICYGNDYGIHLSHADSAENVVVANCCTGNDIAGVQNDGTNNIVANNNT